MISWIQRTFQHHFRLIFAVLLVGMVIPFIFTIGSTPGIGRPDRRSAERDYFGHNLLSPEDLGRISEDARISAELQYGSGISPEQIQFFMFQRVAAQHIAQQLHIPAPTQDEITNFIKDLRVFVGSDGQFDATKYDAFRSSLKLGTGLTEGDILRVISDDVRMAKVQRLLAGPGFVSDSDVADMLKKGDTSWTLSTATVDYAKYETGLSISEAQISKFFTDNAFRYTVAPRVEVTYVNFPAEGFVGSQSATDAEVRQFFDANPARFPKPASSDPKVSSDPAAQFAAVQGQVRLSLLLEKAKQSAVKAASDLAYALYDGKVTRQAVDDFLAARHLKAASLAPFTSDAGPPELGGSRAIASAAFELNADRFYSEGLPTQDGAVVLFWKNSLPSYQPTLAEVHDKVRADAVDNERRIQFIAFGRSLKAGIERRLKEGESFDKAAAEAASPVAVVVKGFPAFTLRAPPKDIDPSVMSNLDRLEKGSVSDMEATADRGILVYAADKKVPAVDPTSSRYAQIRSQLAATYARTTSSEAIREIVENELKRTDTSTASK
jgi:peptidyl-prolyl cis-trans isomerase D